MRARVCVSVRVGSGVEVPALVKANIVCPLADYTQNTQHENQPIVAKDIADQLAAGDTTIFGCMIEVCVSVCLFVCVSVSLL